MAKFKPSEHVERLEFDFTEYGGTEGVIQEPSTGKVNTFFASMKAMLKEVGELQRMAKDLEVEETDEDISVEDLQAKMGQVDEAQDGATLLQKRSIENLALLCGAERQHNPDWEEQGVPEYTVVGGSPNVEELERLPFRVLQAFSTWLMGEIRPKKTTPGGKR